MHEYSEFTSGLPAPVSSSGAGSAAPAGNLATLIGRIEEAVEAETAAIRTDPTFDIKAVRPDSEAASRKA